MSTVETAGEAPPKEKIELTCVPLTVTIPQAASLLNVGKTTIKQLIREERLRSVLIFGARRIPYSALKEFSERGT